MKPVALALALVVTVACTVAPAASSRPADLAAQVESWRERAGVAGLVVALRGSRVEDLASGTQAIEEGPPVLPATQFRIASITKMFVATVVLQLVEEGAFALDARVTDIVGGDLPVPGSVTVRQVLNHTSGLPDYGTEAFVETLIRDRERTWDATALLSTLSSQRASFPPGQGWEYSNSNYVVLGEVIAATTGRPWHAEVRRRILRPLGLRSTYVAGAEPARGAGLVAAAYFDLDNDGDQEDIEHGSWPALETSEGPAGAMVSTAADVASFTAALFGGRLLGAAALKEMVTGTPFGRRYDDYGLGVELSHPDLQTPVWGHGGFLPGYRSTTWYLPGEELTVTILLNDSRAAPADLAELLVRLMR